MRFSVRQKSFSLTSVHCLAFHLWNWNVFPGIFVLSFSNSESFLASPSWQFLACAWMLLAHCIHFCNKDWAYSMSEHSSILNICCCVTILRETLLFLYVRHQNPMCVWADCWLMSCSFQANRWTNIQFLCIFKIFTYYSVPCDFISFEWTDMFELG